MDHDPIVQSNCFFKKVTHLLLGYTRMMFGKVEFSAPPHTYNSWATSLVPPAGYYLAVG